MLGTIQKLAILPVLLTLTPIVTSVASPFPFNQYIMSSNNNDMGEVYERYVPSSPH